jgi:imidazolonepropionase-like amidohydrolase
MELPMRSLNQQTRRRVAAVAFALALLPLLGACAAQDASEAPVAAATLFEGARIIVGDGSEPIEDGAFVVENGRFVQVGRRGEVEAPEGAARVDLAGKTVIPALVNTHVHLSNAREELVDQLQHYAYYGVGTVQSLGLDSSAVTLQMRNELVPGGSRYLMSGRGITSPEEGRTTVPYWITTEEQARTAVRELAANGIQLVKIWVDDRNGQYVKLSPELYTAVIDEAHRNNQRVAAHIFALEDAKGLLRAGLDAFAHSVRDMPIDDEGLQLLREHPDFVLIPNLPDGGRASDLSFLAGTVPAAELQEMQGNAGDRPEVQERFAIQGGNLAKFNEAGVKIAMGTDGSVPWAAHLEMADMVHGGMTPAQVITAATSTSAALLRLDDVGTVAAGKSADFLVLDANPLDDIQNTRRISSVYLRGEQTDRAATAQRLLAQAEAAAAAEAAQQAAPQAQGQGAPARP